jgi:uncharacterized protein YggU (UPF0235/DUF167 family)
VTPRASRDAAGGLAQGPDGSVFLKVMVTAAAEGGKANAAVQKLLAKSWKVPKSAIGIVAGETDRRKLLHVAGDPYELETKLTRWMEENGDG